MVAIPTWATGKNIGGTLNIQGVTPAADGTLTIATPGTPTWSTTTNLAGALQSIETSNEPDQLRIEAMDTTRNNKVITGNSQSVTLVELLRQGATSGVAGYNILRAFANAYDYGYFTYTLGGVTGNKTFSFYGLRGKYDEHVDRDSPATGTLTLDMIDPGAANPAIA